MYYPDLSEHDYSVNHEPFIFKEVLNVGWLENGYAYTKGIVDKAVIEKLRRLLTINGSFIRYKGYHICDLCDPRAASLPVNGKKLPTVERQPAKGDKVLWIPSPQGYVYAAPSLIYHYITDHNYLPPAAFIRALDEFDLQSKWNAETFLAELREKYRSLYSDDERQQWYREIIVRRRLGLEYLGDAYIDTMVNIIRETFPGKLTKRTAIMLTCIMNEYFIYVDPQKLLSKPKFSLIDLSLREVCEIISQLDIDVNPPITRYKQWLPHYLDEYRQRGDSVEFRENVEMVINTLTRHPWVQKIDQIDPYEGC